MDYSLIVGIHDMTDEDTNSRNSFPMPADEEEDDDDAAAPCPDETPEDNHDEEKNGVGEDGEGDPPSPPDSPQPITPMPPFSGDLDPELERFGVRSVEGKYSQC